ncbi:MAG: TlpA family protein disulfide reductase [Chromatiales bacterium]|nr:TlpA family protein disulfide reductase [Chromatiales bacterium]
MPEYIVKVLSPPVLTLILILLSAPAAALQDFDGRPAGLADHIGQDERWLVVMIWESNCPACNRVAHQYVDFHEFNADRRARVLGISIDGPAAVADAKAFVERHQVQFPNLIGDPAEVAMRYRQLTGNAFVGTPSFLLFDPQGQLRGYQAGMMPAEVVERFIDEAAAGSAAR